MDTVSGLFLMFTPASPEPGHVALIVVRVMYLSLQGKSKMFHQFVDGFSLVICQRIGAV